MKLLVIAALAVGLGTAGAAPAVDVTIPGRFFSPNELNVLVGTTITWRNADTTTHTVTAVDGSFDSGYLTPGSTYQRTFTKPGVYAFYCSIHRFMRGVVRVYALVLTGPQQPLHPGAGVILAGRAPPGTTDIVLEQAGRGGWQPVGHHKAAADGGYSLHATVSAPARYRARAGGTTSPVVSVHVSPSVSIRVSGGRVIVRTSPARPGTRAVLEAYDRELFAFVPEAATRLGANGAGQLTLPRAPGEHLRVIVAGNGGWSDGRSPVILAGRLR